MAKLDQQQSRAVGDGQTDLNERVLRVESALSKTKRVCEVGVPVAVATSSC